MEINLFDIVQHIINIVVLYILIRALLYNPVNDFIQKRKEKQDKQQKELDEALVAAKESETQSKQWLSDTQVKTQQLIDEKKAYAEQVAAKTIEDAKLEAAHIIEEAHERIKEDRQKAQDGFVDQTANVAVELAKNILNREIKQEDNQSLIDDFFRKVG